MIIRLLRGLGHTTLGVLALAASAAAQGAPNQPASNPACVRLESQLAAINCRLDRSGPRRPDQARRRRRRQAAGRPRPHRCASAQAGLRGTRILVAVLESGRRNAGRSTRKSSRCAATSIARPPISSSSRAAPAARTASAARVIGQLAQNNCGAQYTAAANEAGPRGFFDKLFGGGNGSGGGTILNPGGDGLPAGTFRTVCVRTCDGYYFPISYSTVPSRFADDERSCQRLCPAAEVALYSFHNPGEDMEQAVSVERPALYGAAERLPLSQGVHGGLLVPQAGAELGRRAQGRRRLHDAARRRHRRHRPDREDAIASAAAQAGQGCARRRSAGRRHDGTCNDTCNNTRADTGIRAAGEQHRSCEENRADRRPAVRVASRNDQKSAAPAFAIAALLTRVRSGSGSAWPESWNRLTIG